MAASSNKALASTTALLLTLNLLLLLFSLASCNSAPCPPEPTKPQPQPTPRPRHHHGSCPRDTLKLGACADVLGGLININVGKSPKTPCCSFLQGLADLEAAACLCTAIKANVLGLNLNVPVSLSLLLNYCGKKVPEGYKCA
ncbi:14 kDa proline-rich protein DC2.15-like [Asparagus officinalis]|uniref:14 kDa proline-rich protein DC2.15-like n=1 Tax=Asparagus officinalis TaxID=4686 RepID=UPI00098E5DE1|nr:14 kDa proline-rich protein DC2.15-like [Asparagus officinalis]